MEAFIDRTELVHNNHRGSNSWLPGHHRAAVRPLIGAKYGFDHHEYEVEEDDGDCQTDWH